MKVTLSEIFPQPAIHHNLSAAVLAEQIVDMGRGTRTDTGAIAIHTGEFTGRSPKDKFTVKDQITSATVDWNNFNQPISEAHFNLLKEDMLAYLNQREALWTRDVFAAADPAYRLAVRVVNEFPESNLFAYNMFIQPTDDELEAFEQDWLILQAPHFHADPAKHGTRQHNFSVLSFTDRTILIGGSGYTGEIKKGVFSVLNFLLPHDHQVLSMHCSANVGKAGDVALFFGLSGTGKTTLSTDPERRLIGDDEHGWSDTHVFNFEGGCYAKVVNLSKENEPEIYRAIRSGAILENVIFKENSNEVDYTNVSITENTRVSYPLDYIDQALIPSVAGLPKNIFFLTCDAYGVLPPISKLSPEQAMFYFVNGYTAKIAGTEEGVKEPQATFSTCFGAPFLPLPSKTYALMLGDKIAENNCNVWMVNTGWSGGSYGVGSRIKLRYTRAMINAALSGALDKVSYIEDAVFGLQVPTSCPDVPTELLNPINTWANGEDYIAKAIELKELFTKNAALYELS